MTGNVARHVLLRQQRNSSHILWGLRGETNCAHALTQHIQYDLLLSLDRRSILADFLFASERNTPEFAVEPRKDLKQGTGQIQMLQDAAGHDDFLLDALAGGGRRYSIVSPWVIASTMERVGILAAFKAAVQRSAEIDVFADPLLNLGPAADGLNQMEAIEKAFSRIGVRLHKLPKLHSKIVAIDTDLLCIGSYNWLSADRRGQYARHETSFVYRGRHLEEEISTIVISLRHREEK